jgi:hypothetical protein
MVSIGERFQTGLFCKESGVYRFDGYFDGSANPSPTSEERVIPLAYAEKFPPIRSANKACWWKLISIPK